MVVLANKTLTSYPFEALEPNNQNPLATRPRKIQGHANFFKAGIGLGRHLVCSVKTSALSTTIKVYEPMDDLTKGKKKPAISKMFAGGQDALKPFKVVDSRALLTADYLCLPGILYTSRVFLCALPSIYSMCGLRQGVRGCILGDNRTTVTARSSRYLARLCYSQRERQANSHRTVEWRVSPQLFGFQLFC